MQCATWNWVFARGKLIHFGDGRPLEIRAISHFACPKPLDFGPVNARLRYKASKSFDKQGVVVKLSKPVGVVAQLVEHHNGIVGVRGSNPLGSTILRPERNCFVPGEGWVSSLALAEEDWIGSVLRMAGHPFQARYEPLLRSDSFQLLMRMVFNHILNNEEATIANRDDGENGFQCDRVCIAAQERRQPRAKYAS